jgi:hypothetical protein
MRCKARRLEPARDKRRSRCRRLSGGTCRRRSTQSCWRDRCCTLVPTGQTSSSTHIPSLWDRKPRRSTRCRRDRPEDRKERLVRAVWCKCRSSKRLPGQRTRKRSCTPLGASTPRPVRRTECTNPTLRRRRRRSGGSAGFRTGSSSCKPSRAGASTDTRCTFGPPGRRNARSDIARGIAWLSVGARTRRSHT